MIIELGSPDPYDYLQRIQGFNVRVNGREGTVVRACPNGLWMRWDDARSMTFASWVHIDSIYIH